MYLNKIIKNYLKFCERKINECEKIIASAPPGRLHISRGGKYYTWKILTKEDGRKYLPKNEEELARKLAVKRYYEEQLIDFRQDAEICRRFLKDEAASPRAVQHLFENAAPEYRRLLGESFLSENEKIKLWEAESYEKFQNYPDQLIYTTLKKGERVRSKLEASAASCLCTLGIPYKYEKMTRVGDHRFAVDFTALDVRTYREIPIEMFGMMDSPEYVKSYKAKMHAYINAGYIPGVNFLTFYESPSMPLNTANMKKVLEEFFFNSPPIRFKTSEINEGKAFR